MTTPNPFQHLRLFDNAGAFGKFYILLLGIFGLNNIIVSLQYYGEEVEQYSLDLCENTHGVILMEFGPESSWYKTIDHRIINFINEFRYICDEKWKIFLIKTIFFCGFVFGTFIFGICGDRYGRVLTLIFAHLISIIGNMLLIFTSTFVVHTAGQFCIGFSLNANATMIYILMLEYVRATHRTFFVNVVAAIFSSLASGAAPWLLLSLRYWKNYTIAICVLQALAFFIYLTIPESYRWIASTGHVDRAKIVLVRIATYNKTELKQEIIDCLQKYAHVDIIALGNYKSLFGLLKSKKVKGRMIKLISKTFLLTFSLGVMCAKIKKYGYSIFINTSILAATHLPAAGLAMLIDKFGRRLTASFMLFLTGLYTAGFTVFLTLSDNNDNTTFIFLVIIAIVFIKATALINLQHAGEILPTKFRSQGLCAVSLFGITGYILAPYSYYIQNTYKSFPGISAGVLLLVASIITMFLPETQHKLLPITLLEAEQIEDSNALRIGPIESKKSNNRRSFFQYTDETELNTHNPLTNPTSVEYETIERYSNGRMLVEYKTSETTDGNFEMLSATFFETERDEEEEDEEEISVCVVSVKSPKDNDENNIKEEETEKTNSTISETKGHGAVERTSGKAVEFEDVDESIIYNGKVFNDIELKRRLTL